MKFYHLADVHLGAVPDAGKPWSKARSAELYESFYSVLDRGAAEGVDFIFISGDLFHRQPLKRELKEIDYHFRKCAPVNIVIIAGNHDYIKANSSYVNYPWGENVHFISSKQCVRLYFKGANTCVYGLSYHHYEIKEGLYDGIKPMRDSVPGDCCHILLAHGGDEKHIPIRWRLLETAGFDYVALGHIHKLQIFEKGHMAYCGALEPVDKNDEGIHGFIEGQWENRQLRLHFIPWAKRSYVNLNIEVQPEMSWDAVKDAVRCRIGSGDMERSGDKGHPVGRPEDIYKVTLSGFKDVDMVYDIQEIESLGNIVSVSDQTEYDFDWKSLYEANAGNLLGRYIEKVLGMDLDEQMRRKVLYYGFNALYRTGEHQ